MWRNVGKTKRATEGGENGARKSALFLAPFALRRPFAFSRGPTTSEPACRLGEMR